MYAFFFTRTHTIHSSGTTFLLPLLRCMRFTLFTTDCLIPWALFKLPPLIDLIGTVVPIFPEACYTLPGITPPTHLSLREAKPSRKIFVSHRKRKPFTTLYYNKKRTQSGGKTLHSEQTHSLTMLKIPPGAGGLHRLPLLALRGVSQTALPTGQETAPSSETTDRNFATSAAGFSTMVREHTEMAAILACLLDGCVF